MKILVAFCAILVAVAQVSHAQTQNTVLAETGSEVINALKQLQPVVKVLIDMAAAKSLVDIDLLNNSYESFYYFERSNVNISLMPWLTGTTNTTVLKMLNNVYDTVTAHHVKIVKLRDTGLAFKNSQWGRMKEAGITYGKYSIQAFQFKLMIHVLKKFADGSIVIASVAPCRQKAILVLNPTIQTWNASMYKCFQDKAKNAEQSLIMYNIAWMALFNDMVYFVANNMSKCSENANIENAAAVNLVTEIKRSSFITCMEKAVNISKLFLSTFDSNFITPYQTKLNNELELFSNCYETARQYNINTLATAETAYIACLSTAQSVG